MAVLKASSALNAIRGFVGAVSKSNYAIPRSIGMGIAARANRIGSGFMRRGYWGAGIGGAAGGVYGTFSDNGDGVGLFQRAIAGSLRGAAFGGVAGLGYSAGRVAYRNPGLRKAWGSAAKSFAGR
jgi:hypothetical protein